MKVIARPSAISLLTIPAVETYLQSKGWTKAESVNPNVRIYRGPDDIHGNPLVVVLPARPDLIDTKQRLADVVRTMATLEAKSPQQVAQKIVARRRAMQGVAKTA